MFLLLLVHQSVRKPVLLIAFESMTLTLLSADLLMGGVLVSGVDRDMIFRLSYWTE